MSLFAAQAEDQYETADFPLSELDLPMSDLGGPRSRRIQYLPSDHRPGASDDFLGIEGIGEEDADRLLQLIDELTVVEGEPAGSEDEEAETDEAGAGEGDEEDAVGATASEEEDREPSE
jgi:hypothetical protein